MDIASEFAKAFKSVGKDLRKEKKRRERDARASARRRPMSWDRVTQKEVVFEALPKAIAAASGDGQFAVPTRNLYYALRPLIQDDAPDLKYDYFSQTLLTEYQRDYGIIDGLVRDPRGNLHEPHSGKQVPLGTHDVSGYEFPSYVYDKILYVEKEGLTQIFKTAELGERYDMAIAAGKGVPVEAVRTLFARAERIDCKLFVLHDADPSGYLIARTMAEETERMPDHFVDVVDLGLSVEDAIERGLEAEEFTRKKRLPYWMPHQLTQQELEWFEGEQVWPGQWSCRRVELNAFTAPDLVAYVEEGLAKHGAANKVLPPEDVIAERAKDDLRESIQKLTSDFVEEVVDLDSIVEAMLEDKAGLAKVKKKDLQRLLKDNPPSPWRKYVADEIRERVDAESGELKESVHTTLIERLIELKGGDS